LTQSLKERHDMIWYREQVLAYELARTMIHKPKVGVWMILLPLLFVFFLQDIKKYKSSIRTFVDGFLKNKKIALDLTFNAVSAGTSLEKTLAEFASETQPTFSDQNDLHEKQLREIAFLMKHFQRLLNGKGRTYEELLKEAYPSAGEYASFLDTLFKLEDAVLKSAFPAGTSNKEAGELVTLMQNTVRRMRLQERDRVFYS
jgi:hypothetical protein